MGYPLTAKQRFPMTKMRYEQATSRLSARERRRRCDEGIRKIRLSDKQPNSCGFSPHYFWQKRQKSYRGGLPAFPPGCSAKRQARLSGNSKEETV